MKKNNVVESNAKIRKETGSEHMNPKETPFLKSRDKLWVPEFDLYQVAVLSCKKFLKNTNCSLDMLLLITKL